MLRLILAIIPFYLFFSLPVFSQNKDGLKEIVSLQQEKIARIETNLKTLIGSLEKLTNIDNKNKITENLEKQIIDINQKLIFLENNVKNITNLSYNLEFALKRIERHLELTAIQSTNLDTKNEILNKNPNPVEKKLTNIKKKSLDNKTDGVLGFIKEPNSMSDDNVSDKASSNNYDSNKISRQSNINNKKLLTKGSAEEDYNFALDFASDLDFVNAEKAFKEFLVTYKDSKKTADAQYWLGRVYFAQKKFEEAAIALAEFNSVFPEDPRFQETTLLIAESAANFAPKDQLCNILTQSLEFMINPSEKFITRIDVLKNENQCNVE